MTTPMLSEWKPEGSTPTKRAGGLDRVPRNGFPAILHKDERVQTKAEADDYRSGRGSGNSGASGNVTLTGNTFIVRQESDIQSIAYALARELSR